MDGTITMHGDVRLIFSSIGSVISMSMSGNSIYIVTSQEAVRLTNYDLSFSYNQSESTIVTDANFTVGTMALQGSITVDSHLEANGLAAYPNSGSITITGNNSILSVEVLNSFEVEVSLTIGGTLQTDYPKIIPWQDLDVEIQNDFS